MEKNNVDQLEAVNKIKSSAENIALNVKYDLEMQLKKQKVGYGNFVGCHR